MYIFETGYTNSHIELKYFSILPISYKITKKLYNLF